jgi:hypothetical protein
VLSRKISLPPNAEGVAAKCQLINSLGGSFGSKSLDCAQLVPAEPEKPAEKGKAA